jgi:predicted ABC-type transport system involved in lysophospholipase L1 biosynthesis ATPase subunit
MLPTDRAIRLNAEKCEKYQSKATLNTRGQLSRRLLLIRTSGISGIDLDVPRGEFFGLLGPNGAGKSTTIGMLTTLVAPTGGSAWVAGHDVTRQTVAVKRRIGVVTQNNTLDMQLTVAENLEYRSRFFGLPKSVAARRAATLIEAFGLADRKNAMADKLSGGQARRLMIASSTRSIRFAPMPDADHENDQLVVADLVDDPVVADPQPVPIRVAGELLDVGVGPARIVPEPRQRVQDRERGGLRDRLQLPDRVLPPAEGELHGAPGPCSSATSCSSSKMAAMTSDMPYVFASGSSSRSRSASREK